MRIRNKWYKEIYWYLIENKDLVGVFMMGFAVALAYSLFMGYL